MLAEWREERVNLSNTGWAEDMAAALATGAVYRK